MPIRNSNFQLVKNRVLEFLNNPAPNFDNGLQMGNAAADARQLIGATADYRGFEETAFTESATVLGGDVLRHYASTLDPQVLAPWAPQGPEAAAKLHRYLGRIEQVNGAVTRLSNVEF